METLTPEGRKTVEELAQRYGVSNQAVTTLLQALIAGHGAMAQFNHPELGGPGQWAQGGMIMIGDMFNTALKAKVDELCSELSNLLRQESSLTRARTDNPDSLFVPAATGSFTGWWGADLGPAGASGAQNNIRYAWFPAARRLAIGIDDRVTIYDSADHAISGISQQQGGDSSLSFMSQHGQVPVAELRVVSPESPARATEPANPKPQQPESEPPPPTDDVFFKLEQLAQLHAKGIVSDEEFASKKADLLGRL